MAIERKASMVKWLQQGYIWLSSKGQWLCSKWRLWDLRLRGAKVGQGVRILGPIDCRHGHGLEIGDRAVIGRGAKIIIAPGARLIIDQSGHIGERVLLTVKRGGELRLGAHVVINTGSIVTCWSQVQIGADTLVAPHCHITDRNHGIAPGELIRKQRGDIAPITIGADVWIASSCVVLKGTTIGEGAVVGANSVVTKDIPPHAIAVGSPARVMAWRDQPSRAVNDVAL